MSKDVKPWDMLNPNEDRSGEDLIAYRMSVCQTCEFFRARTQQCKKCGCFMKLKSTLKRAKCPVGKW
jgi:hypothetical protein